MSTSHKSENDSDPTHDDHEAHFSISRFKSVNAFFIVLGTALLILGLLSLVLPILPGFLFLVLAAACYARGSKRFYLWLVRSPWIGPRIREWRRDPGLTWKSKIWIVLFLLVTLGTSITIVIPEPEWQVGVGVLVLLLCIYILRLPTKKDG